MRALLLEFLATIRLVPFGEWGLSVLTLCDSCWQFPFRLVDRAQGEKLCYTPRIDFHMRIRNFPHLLLEINSQPNESDRYRLLLHASCLARLGNSLSRLLLWSSILTRISRLLSTFCTSLWQPAPRYCVQPLNRFATANGIFRFKVQ